MYTLYVYIETVYGSSMHTRSINCATAAAGACMRDSRILQQDPWPGCTSPIVNNSTEPDCTGADQLLTDRSQPAAACTRAYSLLLAAAAPAAAHDLYCVMSACMVSICFTAAASASSLAFWTSTGTLSA